MACVTADSGDLHTRILGVADCLLFDGNRNHAAGNRAIGRFLEQFADCLGAAVTGQTGVAAVARPRAAIGGVAAVLSQSSIKSIECVEYPELGMEAIWKIEVEDFPAFILVDDKGNDFFKQLKPCSGCTIL